MRLRVNESTHPTQAADSSGREALVGHGKNRLRCCEQLKKDGRLHHPTKVCKEAHEKRMGNMQPLFAQNPLFQDVLVVGYVIWAVTEVILGIRQITLLRAGTKLQDQGSRVVVAATVGLGILLC